METPRQKLVRLAAKVHYAAKVNINLGDEGLSKSKFCIVRGDFKLSAH